MSGRGTQYAGRVGLRPSVGDAIGGLVRPLGAIEQMFHLNEQKSTKHFCVVAELADDVDPFALAGALLAVQRRHPLLNVYVRAVRGSAVFNQFETGLGLIPAGSGSQHLPRLLGRGRALEVILGHDDFDADIAERYGWVNRALDEKSIDGFIDRLASRIAIQPLWLLAAAKGAADALLPSFQHGLELEREVSRAALAAPESRALMADFLARGGQTEAGERRLGELVGELTGTE